MDEIRKQEIRIKSLEESAAFASDRERKLRHKVEVAQAAHEEAEFHFSVAVSSLSDARKVLGYLKNKIVAPEGTRPETGQ